MISVDTFSWHSLWPILTLAGLGAFGGYVAHRFTIGNKDKRLAQNLLTEAPIWTTLLVGALAPIVAWVESGTNATLTLAQVPPAMSKLNAGDVLTAFTLGLASSGWFTNWSKRRVTQLLGAEAAAAPANQAAARALAAGNSRVAAAELAKKPSARATLEQKDS